ncbi:hypothetical protein [Desulfovibrio sp. TomC]|uniref:hypothetical protein n=1 Tax=Desulfovibrio sp. TomC TaxID=1562888 RepID=UPI0012E1FE0F|nr:hypothetical protein [Desulfovibrio sp. TomC]
MKLLIVLCVVGTLFGLCLGVYAKKEFDKLYPKECSEKGMLGFGSEFLLYDKSVPYSTQKIFLTSNILLLTAIVSGLVASLYFKNYGWTKVFPFPLFLSAYTVSRHLYFFCKSNRKSANGT